MIRDKAIRNTHPNVFIVNGGVDAYDKDGSKIELDESLISAEIVKIQAQELADQEAQTQAKDSALSKLSALGLTQDEISALVG
jgi:3-mercaptopyruvate sulfurtransferase SseA